MQGRDRAGAWQQLQDAMTNFLKRYEYYKLLEYNRFENLLEQGFKLDQALPEMFLSWRQQVEEARREPFIDERRLHLVEQVLTFLLKTHNLWETGKLSETRCISVTSRCLGLIKQGIPLSEPYSPCWNSWLRIPNGIQRPKPYWRIFTGS